LSPSNPGKVVAQRLWERAPPNPIPPANKRDGWGACGNQSAVTCPAKLPWAGKLWGSIALTIIGDRSADDSGLK